MLVEELKVVEFSSLMLVLYTFFLYTWKSDSTELTELNDVEAQLIFQLIKVQF